MKEVKAIIQPHLLDRVMQRLHELPHFSGATVSECQGQARGLGPHGHYVATEQTIFFEPRTKLEMFCADAACDEVVRTIRQAAHTGNPGDGIIMVADLDRVVRIRTGEEQDEAV